MPNKVKRNSEVVDMLAKVSVHRGSLIKGIENLLKTIESSESAVMIPTLLRDKCEFDAWELLFVAKILKASILGHVDLVEFYMNHIGLSASQFAQQANQQQQQSTPAQTPTNPQHPIQAGHQTLISNMSSSSVTIGHDGLSSVPSDERRSDASSPPPSSSLNSFSPCSLISSLTATTSTDTTKNNHNKQEDSSFLPSTSWTGESEINTAGADNCIKSSSSSTTNNNNNSDLCISGCSQPLSSSIIASIPAQVTSLLNHSPESSINLPQAAPEGGSTQVNSDELTNKKDCDPIRPDLPQVASKGGAQVVAAAAAAVGAQQQRQAQPPSLLQLTTKNNHINSLSILDQHLPACSSPAQAAVAGNSLGTTTPLAALSISTSPITNGILPAINNQQPRIIPELRTSRSAGCLFRLNSPGASSPCTPIQTPTTPYPQAETLAKGLQGGLHGDPSAPVKLLLQIEQLKCSIGHVTSLLESVVELYKESIDNIALA